MHRLSLGRRALAGLGLSFLYLNLAPATPAAAQAAPTPDQSYYWCSRQMTVHGTNVEYVSRVKDEENSFYNWNYACKTSWPYGYIALDAPRKRALAAGAVAVDWEYTPDQDAPPPYATQPAAAGAPVVSSHRGHHNTATPAPASPAPPPTVTATPAATPHPAAATTPTPAVPEPPKSPYVVCIAEHDPL